MVTMHYVYTYTISRRTVSRKLKAVESLTRKYADGELCQYAKFLRKYLFFWLLNALLARFTLVCHNWINFNNVYCVFDGMETVSQ